MAETFQFREVDEEGRETLEAIAGAHRFNRWMYERVAAHLVPGNVLEIGSGIGNISTYFLDEGREVYLSDLRDNYLDELKEKFSQRNNLAGLFNLDIVAPDFDEKWGDYFGTFDNIYALNVVEHIEDDGLAIANCKKLLREGGRLFILVPAYQTLYNQFDKALEHYRRYNRKRLTKLFVDNTFKVKGSFYFNFIGMFGWFVSGKILRKKVIPAGQMRLYNKLVPIFRQIDNLTFKRMGLSVVVVGEK